VVLLSRGYVEAVYAMEAARFNSTALLSSSAGAFSMIGL
jgi:hypothetical protein